MATPRNWPRGNSDAVCPKPGRPSRLLEPVLLKIERTQPNSKHVPTAAEHPPPSCAVHPREHRRLRARTAPRGTTFALESCVLLTRRVFPRLSLPHVSDLRTNAPPPWAPRPSLARPLSGTALRGGRTHAAPAPKHARALGRRARSALLTAASPVPANLPDTPQARRMCQRSGKCEHLLPTRQPSAHTHGPDEIQLRDEGQARDGRVGAQGEG